jgi:hypothetical protein
MTDGPALIHLLSLLPSTPLRAGSVKLTQHSVSDGRVLCTLPRAAFAPQSARRFIEISEAFTGISCSALLPVLPQCELFHFGIDPQGGGGRDANLDPVRKVYAELSTPDSESPDPGLNYLALKISDGRSLLTHYRNHPMQDRDAALALLAGIRLPHFLRFATEALMFWLVDQTTAPDVLDVVEHGSTRRSIDINFSDHPLTSEGVVLLHDVLTALRPSDARIAGFLRATISHLAIGTSAAGQAFVTLYGFPIPPANQRRTNA